MSYEMLVQQAAIMNNWPMRYDGTQVTLEIPTEAGRTQVVNCTPGRDADGEQAVFFWSRAGDNRVLQQDPWGMFQLSAQLTYGKVCFYNNETVIMHALYGGGMTVPEIAKAIKCVGKAADEIERRFFGADTL